MSTTTLSLEEQRFLKRLGAKLRSIRTDRGWTLEQVEEKGWNNWQHLQKIESGKNITIVTMRKVAKLYGLSLGELLKEL